VANAFTLLHVAVFMFTFMLCVLLTSYVTLFVIRVTALLRALTVCFYCIAVVVVVATCVADIDTLLLIL